MSPFSFIRNKKTFYGLFFFTLWIGNFLYSNPTEGSVAAGSATITDILKTTLINQSSDKLILNWRDFSIASDETTRFMMPSASSSVLNRVTGGNLSSILGTLQANGNVYLINPNGVLMGAGANIQCNSFIASTLDISNDHFLAGGDLNFSGDSSAKITNLGKITASGGDVFLIARQIENYGEIRAENGTVGLASGSEILLKPAGSERIFVKAGTLPSGTAIEQQGYLSGIRTELKAAGSLSSLAINNGGFIQATQVERIGGEVYLRAPKGKVRNTGTITATGNQKGGKVVIEGNQIGIAGTIDVSGGERAGTLNIGGGFQGKESSIENAQQVKISSEAKLFANNGNGEKSEEKNLVIWSDGVTEYYGAMEAKGSNVEISGKGNLVYQGNVDLGGNGSLLLDPQNLQIRDTNPGAFTNRTLASDLDQFTDNVAENSYLTTTDLLSLLATGNVTLQANTDITFASTVNASGALYSGRSLTTNAGRRITFNSNISLTLNGGNYTATINDAGAQAAQRTAGNAYFYMDGGSSLTTNGGSVNVSVGNYGGSTSGAIVIGNNTTTATMSSGGGNIALTGVGTASNIYGVLIELGNVSSGSGNTTITGTGVAGTTNAAGIYLNNQGNVSTTGSGTITMNGTGGNGTSSNYGILINQAGSLISTVNGNIVLTGTGIGSTVSNIGVWLVNGGIINSTGAGSITVNGTGAAGSNDNYGVFVSSGGQINSTGTGTIAVNGSGGNGTTGNDGVRVEGTNALISTVNANMTLTGTGYGSGGSNRGVLLFNGGKATTSGTGSIVIDGTGATAGTGNYGFWLLTNSEVNSSSTGAITVTGRALATDFGIRVNGGSNVIGGASAKGDITLISNTATAGNDSISLANLSLQTTGKVNLKPLNDSTTIGVNTGSTGDFNLSSTDLATITAGNSGIVIGKTTGTGAVDLRATTWTDGVTVLNTGTGASGITVNGIQTAGANKNLVLATGAFSNAVGAGALAVSGTGKWLVYVPDAANGTATDITVNGATPSATLSGLSSKYLYNGTYDTLAPTSITQTGNRFVFATAATLTFIANDAQKNYGEANPNFTYSDPSGLLGTDTKVNAFQGTLGTFSAANSVTSPIVLSNGPGASDLNYRFQFVNGTLTTIFNPSSSPAFQELQSERGGSTPEVTLSSQILLTSFNSERAPILKAPAFNPTDSNRYQYRIHQGIDPQSNTAQIKTSDLKNSLETQKMIKAEKQDPEANKILMRWYQRLFGER